VNTEANGGTRVASSSGILYCQCYPIENCVYPEKDASQSAHKCAVCKAPIFAVCMPAFEDTNDVNCRNYHNKTKRKTQPSKADSESEDDRESKDEREVYQKKKRGGSTLRNRLATRRSTRNTAKEANTKLNKLFQDEESVDYHAQPNILFKRHVIRYGKNTPDETFEGKIMSYNSKKRKFHVHYYSDNESEDLTQPPTLQ